MEFAQWREWSSTEVAFFVSTFCGLPEYEVALTQNITGAALEQLSLANMLAKGLSRAGVCNDEHQRDIARAVALLFSEEPDNLNELLNHKITESHLREMQNKYEALHPKRPKGERPPRQNPRSRFDYPLRCDETVNLSFQPAPSSKELQRPASPGTHGLAGLADRLTPRLWTAATDKPTEKQRSSIMTMAMTAPGMLSSGVAPPSAALAQHRRLSSHMAKSTSDYEEMRGDCQQAPVYCTIARSAEAEMELVVSKASTLHPTKPLPHAHTDGRDLTVKLPPEPTQRKSQNAGSGMDQVTQLLRGRGLATGNAGKGQTLCGVPKKQEAPVAVTAENAVTAGMRGVQKMQKERHERHKHEAHMKQFEEGDPHQYHHKTVADAMIYALGDEDAAQAAVEEEAHLMPGQEVLIGRVSNRGPHHDVMMGHVPTQEEHTAATKLQCIARQRLAKKRVTLLKEGSLGHGPAPGTASSHHSSHSCHSNHSHHPSSRKGSHDVPAIRPAQHEQHASGSLDEHSAATKLQAVQRRKQAVREAELRRHKVNESALNKQKLKVDAIFGEEEHRTHSREPGGSSENLHEQQAATKLQALQRKKLAQREVEAKRQQKQLVHEQQTQRNKTSR